MGYLRRILVYGMTDNLGGIETYVMNMLGSVDKSKVVFDFVTDFSTMAYADEAEKSGSVIYYIPAKSKGVFKHLRAFAKILREHPEYKKVYFNILDSGAAITEFIPWLFGRTVITHSHNGNTDKALLHKLCRPFLLLFTKKRLACSEVAARFMFKKHTAVIIPNAIEAENYNYSADIRDKKRKELNISDKFAVCHIGRLSYQKNPIRVVDIFAEVSKNDEDAVMISVGSGEMDDEVHRYAEEKGISDKIMFLGKRNDISEILQAADVFFLPSLFEGLPIVAVEAQASGLPCILSDNISKEAGITSNVSFLSLELSNIVWANEILSLKDFERKPCLEDIIKAGYDKQHPADGLLRLKEYFEE